MFTNEWLGCYCCERTHPFLSSSVPDQVFVEFMPKRHCLGEKRRTVEHNKQLSVFFNKVLQQSHRAVILRYNRGMKVMDYGSGG